MCDGEEGENNQSAVSEGDSTSESQSVITVTGIRLQHLSLYYHVSDALNVAIVQVYVFSISMQKHVSVVHPGNK